HKLRRPLLPQPAVARGDFVEGAVDVLGHALGVAADVEMGSTREPAPEFLVGFAHLVLHVDLGLAVAGPGEVEAVEETASLHREDLVTVEEVGGLVGIAEKEPVAALRPGRLALLEKG